MPSLKRLLVTLVAGVALWTTTASGAPSNTAPVPRFEIWTPPSLRLHRSDAISSIAQTRDGYLWLGTARGVIRFDGRSSRIFNPDTESAIRGFSIAQLIRDAREGLWILTGRGSLAYYSSGNVRGVGRTEGMPEMGITAALGGDGGVLAVTTDKQLHHFRTNTVTEARIQGLGADAHVRRIIEDTDDRRWLVATDNGLISLFSLTGNQATPTSLSLPDAARIEPAESGGLLVVSGSVLSRYEDNELKPLTEGLPFTDSGSEITAIVEDASGLIWIGSRTRGLIVYSPIHDMVWSPDDLGFSLSRRHVSAILRDRENHIWVSDGAGQLHRIRRRNVESIRPVGSSGFLVRSICEGKDGSMWIGTDGGGLHRIHQDVSERFGIEHGLQGEEIQAVCEDLDGVLWVAVKRNGLFRGINGRFRPERGIPSSEITALHVEPDGALWIGTNDKGLFVRRNKRFKIVDIAHPDGSFEERSVSCIERDDTGALWIGTNGGGLKRIEGEETSHFVHEPNTPGSLPNNYIFALHAADEGRLWIGTSRGLSLIDGESFHPIRMADGLATSHVFEIFEDDLERLWLATDDGILRIESSALEAYLDGGRGEVRCAVFDETDGLRDRPSNVRSHPSACQTSDNKIWIPTGEWATVISPLQMAENPRAPVVVIEDFRIDDKTYDIAQPIVVPPGGEELSIRYAGISFADPHRVTFSHRLEGSDPDWVERRGIGIATYHDLDPGRYTFHLRAANKDGVWTPGAKTLEFELLPPFWLTNWFLAISVATIILLVRYLALKSVRARLRYLLRERALESERARIAKDMHDDLGANLTQIGLMSELMRRNPDNPAEVEKNAMRIAERSRQVSLTLDEIVWAVNPKNDSLDKLANYLVHFAEEFLEPTDIRLRLDVPPKLPEWKIDSELRHNIFMIVKEAMNNSVKYSNADEIKLHISIDGRNLQIAVTDNGEGFDPQAPGATGSDGLANMRKRVEDHDGVLTLESSAGGGASVAFIFKLSV